MTTRFKKGQLTKEAFEVIMYDLGCLSIDFDDHDTFDHYHLLIENLRDLFGRRNIAKWEKENETN